MNYPPHLIYITYPSKPSILIQKAANLPSSLSDSLLYTWDHKGAQLLLTIPWKNRSESYHSSVRLLLLLITRQELLSRDRQILLLYYIPNSIFSEIKIKQLVPPNGMVFFFHHEAIISLSHPKNRLKQRSAAALILQSNLILAEFFNKFFTIELTSIEIYFT